MLNSLSCLLAVFAVQVVLNPLPAVPLGRPDASLQVDSGRTVKRLVTRPEGIVPLLQKPLDLLRHTWLLIGMLGWTRINLSTVTLPMQFLM